MVVRFAGIPAFALITLAALGMSSWRSDCGGSVQLAAQEASSDAELPQSKVEFSRDIRPLLSNSCYECHGPDAEARQSDLRLDNREGLFQELESGNFAVVPGDLEASELFQRITSSDPDLQMPPPDTEERLSPAQIDRVRRWIEQGAEWQGHWAYVPVTRPEMPPVTASDWVRNPIDAFVLARLETEGVRPSAPADRITLLRRLYFDLTGLPPSAEDVERYLADERPDAVERLVDELLGSPAFGERMAIHWLDLVRYADSCGYHSDVPQSISPYRDYVIQAFNENLAFDQFTREQLAGDLLPNPTTRQLVATGYNRLNKTTEEGGAQPGEYLVKYAADRVRTTSGTWLGSTLGCAECHDHKYDPFTARDFYSFVAFFADVQETGTYRGGRREPEMLVPNRLQQQQLEQLETRAKQLESELASSQDESQRARHAAELKKITELIEQLKKQFTRTMITASTKPREIRILPRGDWLDRSGPVVQPALPQFLSGGDDDRLAAGSESHRLTRLDLAEWLVSRDNPLTARVFTNRLWHLCFGKGLSRQLDDVGAQGEPPSHPRLLDWMAAEFMESGWDMKHIIRLIVTSNAYRQSSVPSDELLARDPLNRLFARQGRWRLEAEMVRDNALAISGLLVPKLGGPSVKPYQPAGYWQHMNFPTRTYEADRGEDQFRRGLYTHWQRTFLHPSLLAFDAPTREECTAERARSNTPKAALTLLNDPSYVEAARGFAARIMRQASNPETRVRWAFQQAFSRPPTSQESEIVGRQYEEAYNYYRQDEKRAAALLDVGLSQTPANLDRAELAAWTDVARVLLNLNECITRN